ncbi:MAG: hypothetical protein ABIK83_05260 [Candidatus Zixiibacteriota bacterium]
MNKYVEEVYLKMLGDRCHEPSFQHQMKYISGSLTGHVLPFANETAAIATRSMKTAALCFDRVWVPPTAGAPESVAFFGGTEVEIKVVTASLLTNAMIRDIIARNLAPEELRDELVTLAQRIEETCFGYRSPKEKLLGLPDPGFSPNDIFNREAAEAIGRATRRHIVPFYDNVARRDAEYRAGDYSVVVVSLTELEVVVEELLKWQQVLDFRADEEARAKFRRMVHWLDADMIGRSHEFIVDEIAKRLEEYMSALRKHGIRTVLGAMSAVFDPKSLAFTCGAAKFATDAIGPEAGVLAGGSFLIGKMALNIARNMLDIDDRKDAHKEIAFVIEVREKFAAG